MSRWRDTKQGKKQKSQVKETPSFNYEPCSSIPSRLKAFLTDSFLITTPIIYIVLYLIMGGGENFSSNLGIGWMIIVIIHAPIILFFWLVKAQTPGPKSYNLKVVHAQSKKDISFTQAVIRYVATLFTIITIFLIFLPFFRKDKRTFQDLFSNSIIIDQE